MDKTQSNLPVAPKQWDGWPSSLPQVAEPTARKLRGKPFEKGQSGNPNGRPKGSRNKLTDMFLAAVADDFAEHGAEAIEHVRKADPAAYLKLVGTLVPRDLISQRERTIDFSKMDWEELWDILQREEVNRHMRLMLSKIETPD